MLKIVELKETIKDSALTNNIYDMQKIIQKIILNLEFIEEINKDDYNYLEILTEKSKIALEKTLDIMKYSI